MIPKYSIEIIRLEDNPIYGTFGILKINKLVFCCTLEPPDLMGARNMSSIPERQYICKPYSSNKYPNVYQIMDVPTRSRVLFCAGDVLRDSKGCVILGEKFDKLRDARHAKNTGKTFEIFRSVIGDSDFHLTIKNAY